MEDYIVHYGILGMKWGIRRYQNKDGSLTPAGKKRLEKLDKEREALIGNQSSRDSSSSSSTKKVSEMSDEELRDAVMRLQLEQRYKELKPKHVSAGKRFVKKIINDILIPSATDVAKKAVKEELGVLWDKMKSGSKADAKSTNKKKEKSKNSNTSTSTSDSFNSSSRSNDDEEVE